MNVIIRISFLLLFFGAAGIPVPAAPIQSLKPGIYQQEMNREDGSIVRYGLFIPTRIENAEKIPLIIALHYGGQVTPYYGLSYMKLLVEPSFRRFGAIIVAPDCPFQTWRTERSETAVIDLIEYLKGSYPIDDRCIALTGFSLGGMGTWHLIARHSDIFSAAIVMSGRSDPKDLEMITTTPIYIIHSDADEVLPLANARESFTALKQKGVPVYLKIVRGIGHYRTADFIPALESARTWLKKTWKIK